MSHSKIIIIQNKNSLLKQGGSHLETKILKSYFQLQSQFKLFNTSSVVPMLRKNLRLRGLNFTNLK